MIPSTVGYFRLRHRLHVPSLGRSRDRNTIRIDTAESLSTAAYTSTQYRCQLCTSPACSHQLYVPLPRTDTSCVSLADADTSWVPLSTTDSSCVYLSLVQAPAVCTSPSYRHQLCTSPSYRHELCTSSSYRCKNQSRHD